MNRENKKHKGENEMNRENEMNIEKDMKDIGIALEKHYRLQGYIEKELQAARELVSDGKEYTFSKGIFGTGYVNREHRIFRRDGKYGLFSGWQSSSDDAFVEVV